MKKLKFITCLILLFVFASCENKKRQEIFFDSPFPKKNIDLTRILGDKIVITTISRNKDDTLKIFYNKDYNLIVDNHSDTVFIGKVCKYRGLFYFNKKFNDNSYWIYSVKICDNLIYGLYRIEDQMYKLRYDILNGSYPKLVKAMTKDTSLIILQIDKKELKKYYSSYIEYTIPDTILNFQKVESTINETQNPIVQIDPEEFEFFSKVYPNPTKDIINIELQEKNKTIYNLFDLNGKTVIQGHFDEKINKIDLADKPNGIYFLTLTNLTGTQKEKVKIVKN
ncbi:MAG: T9SS type A sorting domain-containing protein [Bacteroidales bacterium]